MSSLEDIPEKRITLVEVKCEKHKLIFDTSLSVKLTVIRVPHSD